MTGFLDVISYDDEQKKDLKSFSKGYVEIFSDLRDSDKIIKDISQSFHLDKSKYRLNTRRLSAIADYEGKTRVIAIGDYLSQLYLRPIHDRLMKIVKKIPSDMTYRQHELSNIVRGY
jgi:hypothetical protein